MAESTTHQRSLITAVIAAVGALLCCGGPAVLLSLGIGGFWAGHLSALGPYWPILIGVVLVFLGLVFRRLYRASHVCEPANSCASPAKENKEARLTMTQTLHVRGMTCAPCLIKVRKALERVPGITQAKVNLAAATAIVTFDPAKTTVEMLTKATADAGYPSHAVPEPGTSEHRITDTLA